MRNEKERWTRDEVMEVVTGENKGTLALTHRFLSNKAEHISMDHAKVFFLFSADR